MWTNCQTNWEGSEQHLEKSNGETTCKENAYNQYSVISNLMFFVLCIFLMWSHFYKKNYGFIMNLAFFFLAYEIQKKWS